MSFIDKLEKLKLNTPYLENTRQMLVGTYRSYMDTKKEDRLITTIKLAYMLGVQAGIEKCRLGSKKWN